MLPRRAGASSITTRSSRVRKCARRYANRSIPRPGERVGMGLSLPSPQGRGECVVIKLSSNRHLLQSAVSPGSGGNLRPYPCIVRSLQAEKPGAVVSTVGDMIEEFQRIDETPTRIHADP